MKTLFTTAAHRYTQHQGKKDILQFMNTKSTAKEKCSDQSARRNGKYQFAAQDRKRIWISSAVMTTNTTSSISSQKDTNETNQFDLLRLQLLKDARSLDCTWFNKKLQAIKKPSQRLGNTEWSQADSNR